MMKGERKGKEEGEGGSQPQIWIPEIEYYQKCLHIHA